MLFKELFITKMIVRGSIRSEGLITINFLPLCPCPAPGDLQWPGAFVKVLTSKSLVAEINYCKLSYM